MLNSKSSGTPKMPAKNKVSSAGMGNAMSKVAGKTAGKVVGKVAGKFAGKPAQKSAGNFMSQGLGKVAGKPAQKTMGRYQTAITGRGKSGGVMQATAAKPQKARGMKPMKLRTPTRSTAPKPQY